MSLPRATLACLLLVASGGCKAPPPNVLLITVDTVRADHCSLYGYPRATTPVLERLAAEGTVYDQATASASFTMGSVGTILTGLYPSDHGADAHPSMLGADGETIAEALAARGYDTLAVVGNPILKAKFGFDQGFRSYVERNMQLEDGRPVDRAAEKTTALAIAGLKEARGPFMLWVHYMDPHWWYTPPPPFDTSFSARDPEWDRFAAGTFDGTVPIGQVYFNNPLPAAVRQHGVDLYDAEIAHTDQQIGVLLEALTRAGHGEDTIVAVTSDHGESLGQHGITFCHGFFTYEDNLRVPLVIVPPKGPFRVPVRITEPFGLVDLKRTLLGLTGAAEANHAGASPILAESEPLYGSDHPRGNVPGRPRAYVSGRPGKWRSLREGPLKLIVVPHPTSPEIELYDLAVDPDEQHDLAATRPADRDRLLSDLESLVPDMALSPGNVSPPAATP